MLQNASGGGGVGQQPICCVVFQKCVRKPKTLMSTVQQPTRCAAAQTRSSPFSLEALLELGMRFLLSSVLQYRILAACIVTVIAARVVPMVRLPIPQVSSLQCKRTCNSFTADTLQIHCCVRTLACVKLLPMLTLNEDMLQTNMHLLQSNMLELVNIGSHAQKQK